MNDEQAIRETITRWLLASREGDVQALAAILDDDMLFVVRGRPAFGKQEFLAGGHAKPDGFDWEVDIREVVVNGNWALTRVELAIAVTAAGATAPAQFKGPTMTVWRRTTTGRWQIWRDANMVAPLA